MRIFSLFLLIASSICFSRPASAFFFPNITGVPPSLLPNITSVAWDAFKNFSGCRSGEKRNGLAKLKKYFNYFGYIPNSPSNFTDDFDDSLEAAVKTYQKNFNLNVTGLLDDATLKQIIKPRCGNPDIVNGSTSMTSGKPTSFFHSVGHYAFFPGTPRWPEGQTDLTYAFLPGNNLPETAKSAFTRSFARWAAVTPLKFTQTSSYFTADIRIAFYTGDHGDGEPFDGVLGTLAHAFSPPTGMMHLDGDEDWWIEGDIATATVSTTVDLESVAVHEIGHLLGLGHSSVEDAIMFPTISSMMRKVELGTDDVQGIQVLYGSNPNYNLSSSTPAATDPQRESNDGADTVLRWGPRALLAVGFMLVLML